MRFGRQPNRGVSRSSRAGDPCRFRGIRRLSFRWHLLLACALCAVYSGAVVTAHAGAVRHCPRVVNPYEGTVYEGVDLRRIRAENVRCPRARRVARGAHRKALGMAPPGDGVLNFHWRGWRVRGDLEGDSDHYAARREGERRVRWVF
jgi:hypothetical protein